MGRIGMAFFARKIKGTALVQVYINTKDQHVLDARADKIQASVLSASSQEESVG
jgi:hypothetical protein